ncbi:MAG TPA: DEAD/DEAH box helicase family protein [Terriglobales bacterium]|nr:DEAD/DEAH box helicase family protein [Terriglobales bacterium]
MNSQYQYFNGTSSPFPAGLAPIPGLVDEKAQPEITKDEVSEGIPPAPVEEEETHQQDGAPDKAQKALRDGKIHQPAMRIEIPAVATSPTETTDGFFRQRPWQVQCSAELTGNCNFILNAPTAAGKTFELCTIAAERLSRDKNLRVVIAAPQGIIVAGFPAQQD